MACENVGEADPTIAGFGILVGFAGQALISLLLAIWVFLLLWWGRLEVEHDEGTDEYENETKRLEIVSTCLMAGNDLQMTQGVALVITALAARNSISLYHMHLVYDTVSFVGVSCAAAVTCWKLVAWRQPEHRSRKHSNRVSFFSPRLTTMYTFAILFLTFTILFGQRLGGWSEDSANGECYNTHLVTNSSANHPVTDRLYVGITAAWLLISLFAAIFSTRKIAKAILVLALLQFPLHVYMVAALRTANQDSLDGGDENDWDFGQTVATVLLGITLSELLKSFGELYRFEKSLKHPDSASATRTDTEDGKILEDNARNKVKVVERARTWFFDTRSNTF